MKQHDDRFNGYKLASNIRKAGHAVLEAATSVDDLANAYAAVEQAQAAVVARVAVLMDEGDGVYIAGNWTPVLEALQVVKDGLGGRAAARHAFRLVG